ncbi:hypothetical protein [Campylobacter mucosalis]|uniref:Lipoprotein n=1 Tax=Campylobacter mucosalis CCUG 21559 TaxID=1032067 RepID=A0A6G5QEK2_9BACT|nr:hypothetical protein [Campylobacter mucosalis]QCD44125.1 hypothetical protein CMUC_0311 [Campylobacter mucosalis CCUG 21559]QCD44464.1 hypothetical protein CMUC_0665 [Campylobacter mucosalis CCUG 21559]QCD44714.1 hypothetical protein CMUC_0925 [Campylobacter mucosalis CCUG 21559]
MKQILILLALFAFVGCADKQVITEYKKQYIPIKCLNKEDLPTMPTYNPNKPESFNEVVQYVLIAHELLMECVNE